MHNQSGEKVIKILGLAKHKIIDGQDMRIPVFIEEAIHAPL